MTSQLLRKLSAIGTLALFAAIATTPKVLAQNSPSLVLVNNNSQQIMGVYIKSPDSSNWSYALDITEWFASNTSKQININASQCIYDFKIVYISGSFDYGRYDFCKANRLTSTGNGGNYSPSGVYRGGSQLGAYVEAHL